jgi:hypothetical protein
MHILTTILMEQLLHFLRPLAAFSILPPDNATGNFKTVQRLPVKLLLMPITILKNKIIASGNERGYRRTYQIKASYFSL